MDAVKETTSSVDEKVLFSWRSEERLFKQRTKQFYSTIIVLAFLISIILFFIEGLMPVLVVWAIVFVIWATSKTPPSVSEHQITSWGVRTSGKLYRYQEMVVFWIEEKWDKVILHIMLTKFPGQLIILVNKTDEKNFKDLLSDNGITMQKPEATWTDNLTKWFSEKIPLD